MLPLKDLGIKKGAMLVYNLKKFPDERKIAQLSKKYNWAPYNSLASWYLWKSLELSKVIKAALFYFVFDGPVILNAGIFIILLLNIILIGSLFNTKNKD